MSEKSRRRGELVRKVFEILLEAPDGRRAEEIYAQAADELDLNEWERSTFPHNPQKRRFETIVHFSTIPSVKAGWLLREEGVWRITEAGREAWNRLEDPEDFMAEARARYKDWKAAHGSTSDSGGDLSLAGLDAAEVVEVIREREIPSERVSYRAAAEDDARRLLDEFAGRMTREQAIQLGRQFNFDYTGKERFDRFKPAFHGATINKLVDDMDLFNEWTRRLWSQDEEVATRAFDEIVRDRGVFPGAGRSYPSVLMYLRDPKRYAIWLPATIKGLRALTGFRSGTRAGGSTAFLSFCREAQAFTKEHGLEPQELDIILTVAGQEMSSSTEAFLSLTPTLEFLDELRNNNNRQWFQDQKARYRREVHEPFSRLMEAVAERYVRDLDPNLTTEVKTGKVLAQLRKRWPNESGEYNSYFWGAFSRQKKQQDVQLFAIVYPFELRYGLFLGSAQPEHIARLRQAFEADGDQYVRLLNELGQSVRVTPDGQSGAAIKPSEGDDLLVWLEGAEPSIEVTIESGDPRLDSPELIDSLGELFVRLHPLAAVAWGDRPRLLDDTTEESDPAEYTLEDLAGETSLPLDVLEEWIELLKQQSKRQAVFFGPPGTGKTFVAKRLARHLSSGQGEVRTIQFHPAFSYEDFLEGLRPVSKPDGNIGYEIRPGIFLEFCEQARGADGTFVLVIDEINRAEIGAVLGELMMLLEYRGESLELPYSRKRFSIPSNVIVLATMNTADRSLALVDFALRRRFHAIELAPDRQILEAFLEHQGEDIDLPLRVFDLIQQRVADPGFAPGHSFLMGPDLTPRGLDQIWRFQLKPYLREYWFEHPQVLEELESEIESLLAEGG